ncbi:MAG: peptidase S24 [Chlamydiae bacterium CG10_big_fil_rev_8_21_14_0_10_35_9]|nr:MAG: peptidase S24 [Chlamydiae bacterium CG10_big_fil_rev_8_21_14_0_10_35_9]
MKENKLHPIQKKLLELLIKNINEPLTIRKMQYLLEASSTSIVARHLSHLEKKGYLKRNPHNPRDYLVLNQKPEKTIAWLNLYGLAQCGQSGRILDSQPIDRIPIATRLLTFPSCEAFLVKAKGDSMSPRILDGDLIIARQTNNVENNAIVVCINNEETLIKKIKKDGNSIILISLNPAHSPFLAANDFRIVGEVKGIISRE